MQHGCGRGEGTGRGVAEVKEWERLQRHWEVGRLG